MTYENLTTATPPKKETVCNALNIHTQKEKERYSTTLPRNVKHIQVHLS